MPHAIVPTALAQTADNVDQMKPLVRLLASRILAGLPRDSGIEMADLIQAGHVGLIQAGRTFEPLSGAPLAGYAKFRIRGEMLDTVRRHSGRSSAAREARGRMRDGGADIETTIRTSADASPLGLLARRQGRAILEQEMDRLPIRYRTVLKLRYARECSLREIGVALKVKESRACQLHRIALGQLRRALGQRGVTAVSHLM